MIIEVKNLKTGKQIKDIRMITICLDSGGYATISTAEDLKKPFDQAKLTHKLKNLEINIINDG